MPELPEVETTLRGIRPHLEGRRISQLHVFESRLRWPIPADLPAQIEAAVVERLERRGKYLLFMTSRGTMIVHLGMSGSLRLEHPHTATRKHDHVQADLTPELCLRFNDPRRFGAWLWTENWRQHPLLRNLGPEPLGPDFSGSHLFSASRGRTTAVKNFIMDHHQVVGVGNIYAAEALFLAGIHPARAAGRISRARYDILADSIRTVLGNAIEMGGTTLRDFINTDGNPGYFKQSLRVYGRAGQACLTCASTLKASRLGQRATVYCTRCQR
ncbi:bifunctional DNA-formamidopyrimidine glycosylase/DNA-(apurinic or apyrimidinic site) lyase [Hydrocarboniclastica marina]|uniref:Formamidopyrimidine-DNA glycosylase n=1 Tax=Hydrocarboniclastica marina TaxID=2259620 RepID=A0A4P7XG25_9ALTE|nr:bifunctional DNA-formamidopyrimidine glycosylase/DNA-(apurinic or apyrimidinic site) lyase [Hydrocarboniclastica marina]QCF24707.1 bifunctional DNA-formamidopyrimidine glycosylase/DNA-(apurinic or apyrimidinic site) lyase [Hydrocarboniclastica marina]